jgi:hypothetical protein
MNVGVMAFLLLTALNAHTSYRIRSVGHASRSGCSSSIVTEVAGTAHCVMHHDRDARQLNAGGTVQSFGKDRPSLACEQT